MPRRKTDDSQAVRAVLHKDGSVTVDEGRDLLECGGDERILLTEYRQLDKSGAFDWISASRKTTPSSFIRHAAYMGLLIDEDGGQVSLVEGFHSPILIVHKAEGKASFTLAAGADLVAATVVQGGMLLADGRLYETGDEHGLEALSAFLGESVSHENLSLFLSIVASRVPSLEIVIEGWQSVSLKPVVAQPALIFSEVDEYGYLHVTPDSHVDGFPATIVTRKHIVRSVHLDEGEKLVEVRDIIFPVQPVEAFRKLLGKTPKDAVYEEAGTFIIDGPFAKSFLEDHMGELMRSFTLYQPEVLTKYRIRCRRPRVHFSFSSGIDFLEGQASVDLGDGCTMSLDDFLSSYRKEGGYIELPQGEKAYVDTAFMRRLGRFVNRKGGKNLVSAYDIPYLESLEDFEVTGEALAGIRDFYKGLGDISSIPVDTKLRTSALRGYQQDGYRWLRYLHDKGIGGCLADEMGLGKTVQVIALLNAVASGGKGKPSLLIAPKSIIYNWLAEIERFGIGLSVHVYYGQGRNSSSLAKLKGGLVISSYATVRNDIDELSKLSFNYLILDESQNIKHFNTRTAQAVLNLESVHRLAISGTPIENDLGELFSLFRFLNPALFPSLSAFERDYVKPISQDDDKDALSALRMRIHPFILRRLKKDVLKDLPEKSEQVAYIDMVKEHWDFYEERRASLKAQVEGKVVADGLEKSTFIILQALTELRQIATLPEARMDSAAISAKRDYLRQVLPEITASGHKALVFTSFLDTVEAVGEDLEELGIGYVTMTGATRDRQSLVSRFQSDSSTKVFIMTLKTGGVGLNLTAADYVFIMDPWWNAAAEEQAINRTHRIGQVNPVFCYRLIARGTIEEKILELQRMKSELSSALITSDGAALKCLSAEEIEALLG